MKITPLVLGAIAVWAPAAAQQFTLDQVLSSPFPSELTAARRGARIAWVFDEQGRRNIWVAEGPRFAARQLTAYDRDDGQEITDLAFTPDGEWIVYVRGGNANQAGEIPNPTSNAEGARQALYAAAWRDGKTRLLAEGRDPAVSPVRGEVVFLKANQLWIVAVEEGEAKQLFTARGRNGSPAWSPDGRRVAFVSARDDHSFIGVFDVAERSIRYLAPSTDRDSMPRWSPDGREIAFVRQPGRGAERRPMLEDAPEPWSIQVADVAGAAAREVWRSGTALDDSFPSVAGENAIQWAADGRLVFASEQDGWLHLYGIPASGGNAALLTPGACEVEHVAQTPDRRELIYSSNCGDIDRRHLWRVAAAGGAPQALTSGETIEWDPVVTADGRSIVFLQSDARRPGMPFAMPLDGGGPRAIAPDALPRDFPANRLAAPQPVLFRSADGQEIHGQLFLPRRGADGARLPAVVFMHGGPIRQMLLGWHYMYYYHMAYGMNQYLASRGYAVLSVNYRCGIGYGRAFRQAPKRGARGASEYQDIVAAAEYLRGRNDIDPARIGLWGGSYGGYLTALGLARNSDLFAAGVDLHGVHDWSLRISQAPWIDYSDQAARKVARESSPIAAIGTWRSPVLLIQGDDDRNVSFSQMVDLVKRLREQKVTFEQIVFPDEVHDFLLHRNWLAAYRGAAAFFDRKLRAGAP